MAEAHVDDLSGVSEFDTLPDEGWYRAKVLSIESKYSQNGHDMRIATIRLKEPDLYEAVDYMTIGAPGKGGGFAKQKYKRLAISCGFVPEEDGTHKFSPEDLEGKELYVRGVHEPGQGSYPPKWRPVEFRPLAEEPEELVTFEESNLPVDTPPPADEDGLPF